MPSRLARVVDAALEGSVVGSFTRIGPAVRARVDGWQAVADLDMTGRTVLVTGANSGLGLACATLLARTGAHLVLTVRSDEKAAATRQHILASVPDASVETHLLDLTDLAAVHEVGSRIAQQHPTLDAVVHNAGAMFSQRREVDGIETTVLLHVVAPVALTHHLLPSLRASAHPGRIVWVTSGGMYTERLDVTTLQSPDDFTPTRSYARAKRAQVVLAQLMAERLADDGVAVHAMHPGWAATPGVERSLPGFNRVMGPLLRDTTQGADTAAWLVAAPEAAATTGQLWLDRRPRSTQRLPGTRTTPSQAHALWTEVTRLAGTATASVATDVG